jgi:RND family efflux transporter MFP subunit
MGEWLDVGGPVVELVALDELEVRVEVPERHYSSLSPGAPAQVTFESLPGLEVKGKVSAIVPRAETQARTFPVKVRIPGGGGRIGVGMLAQVAMPAGESYRATVIPKDAVVSQGREKVVYLLNGDGTVSPVPVETGAGVGVWVAVNGGIQAGQKVITRGNERLFPGQSVRGEPLEYALP